MSNLIVEFEDKNCAQGCQHDMLGSSLGVSSDCFTKRIAMGIYFLWLRGEVIYVGQSTNVLFRLCAHGQHMVFDFSTFLPVKSFADLDFVESYLIWFLRPQCNRGVPYLGNVGFRDDGCVSDWAFEKVVKVLRSLQKKHVKKTFAIARKKEEKSRNSDWRRNENNDRVQKMLAQAEAGVKKGVERQECDSVEAGLNGI